MPPNMLFYVLRVAFILLWHSVAKERVSPDRPFVVRLRAWPWRCDAYLHMNNAVYLRLAEDARWAWTARSGLLRRSLKERWMFMVGGVDLLYRRQIPLMSSFEVVSRIIGSDGRWLLFSQEFVLPNGQVAARAIVRITVKSPRGDVEPETITAAYGATMPAPSPDVEAMRKLAEAQLAAIQELQKSRGSQATMA